MMAAPPCDQHHEGADDSENGSFRHFFTHLVCMLARLVIYDLRDSGLVTRTYRARARAGSRSICSSVCRLQFISPPSSCVRLRLSGRAAAETTPPREITTTLRIFCFDIMLFRLRMSEVIAFTAILPAGSSRRHYASAGFTGATKERIAYPSSELNARGKRASRSWLRR